MLDHCLKRRDQLPSAPRKRGQEDKECMHGANQHWNCVKSNSILLWNGEFRRVRMSCQSLESESPKAQSHRGPAEGPDSKGDQSPVQSEKRLQIWSPRSSHQIPPERLE